MGKSHVLAGILVLLLCCATAITARNANTWKIHDMLRPERLVVTPGSAAKPPSDAIVLFDGADISRWVGRDGQPTRWVARDGYMECTVGSGYAYTRQGFGNCQLHLEFAEPYPPKGEGQGRGNSGVYLMSRYEIQVLDSYKNRTYADGQAAAIYGQYPPLVNSSLPPGQWQTYDIVFHRPRFDKVGKATAKARFTVFHNGVLVQDDVEANGPTEYCSRLPYTAHPERLPLALQDHGNPIRYRNIWIRELPEGGVLPGDAYDRPPDRFITLSPRILDRYVGNYGGGNRAAVVVTREGQGLAVKTNAPDKLEVMPESETRFVGTEVDVQFVFSVTAAGKVEGFSMTLGGNTTSLKRLE